MDEIRTLFTHSILPSHFDILALRCTLQMPFYCRLEKDYRHSVHLYSVSLPETNEPCS